MLTQRPFCVFSQIKAWNKVICVKHIQSCPGQHCHNVEVQHCDYAMQQGCFELLSSHIVWRENQCARVGLWLHSEWAGWFVITLQKGKWHYYNHLVTLTSHTETLLDGEVFSVPKWMALFLILIFSGVFISIYRILEIL